MKDFLKWSTEKVNPRMRQTDKLWLHIRKVREHNLTNVTKNLHIRNKRCPGALRAKAGRRKNIFWAPTSSWLLPVVGKHSQPARGWVGKQLVLLRCPRLLSCQTSQGNYQARACFKSRVCPFQPMNETLLVWLFFPHSASLCLSTLQSHLCWSTLSGAPHFLTGADDDDEWELKEGLLGPPHTADGGRVSSSGCTTQVGGWEGLA